jgi:Mn2+/Fe2+ NRAMP family transporter
VEVEEKIAKGQHRLSERRGASEEELRDSRKDIVIGMLISNIIMFFIMLSTHHCGRLSDRTSHDDGNVMGWKGTLHGRPKEAKAFYGLIFGFTVLAVALNALGFNPMKALNYSGIVQGFSTPPLLLLIMLMTSNRAIMSNNVKSPAMNVLGWVTVGAIFAATLALVVTWFL